MSSRRDQVQQRKREVRRRYREARSRIDPAERDAASDRIAEHVARAHWFRSSRLIACYLSMSDEVATWPIIERAWRMRKRVFAPICGNDRLLRFCEVRRETELARSDYGLLEPVDGETIEPKRLDLVLMPLVAFDADRGRIGMGGGYYDKTFSFLRNRSTFLKPKLVGLAFACQETERVEKNPWDIGLYRVVTERG